MAKDNFFTPSSSLATVHNNNNNNNNNNSHSHFRHYNTTASSSSSHNSANLGYSNNSSSSNPFLSQQSGTAAVADTMPPKALNSESASKNSLKRPHSAVSNKGNLHYPKDTTTSGFPAGIEHEVLDADILLPNVLPFKRVQISEKYPKGQARGRHWKHLKQILQAENYHLYPAEEPNYVNIESPPSMYPAKKYCDITGFLAPYTDPRTKMRYGSTETFKRIRSIPEDFIQGYLALRNAAVVLK